MEPKRPPFSMDAERAALGAILVSKNAWHAVEPVLKVEDFYRRDHQMIYSACAQLHHVGKTCDQITVVEQLRVMGEIHEHQDAAYVIGLALEAYDHTHAAEHAAVILDYATRRRVIGLCAETIGAAYDEYADEVLAKLGVGLEGISRKTLGQALPFSAVMDRADAAIGEARARRRAGNLLGVPTGLPCLDQRTGGLCAPRLWIIAGRPSLGKSALVSHIALNGAQHGQPGFIASLEMSHEELGYRAMASKARINVTRLSFGSEHEYELGSAAGAELGGLPLWVDTDTFTLPGICAQIAQLRRQHNIAWAAVDHIGLVEADGFDRRVDQLGFISRTFAKLAKRLNIPIALVSQLSRGVEKERRWPVLSDLRDSGSLEQDAHVCLFLHSEDDDEKGDKTIHLGLLKNRGGRKGWIRGRVIFRGATQRYEEQAREEKHDEDAPHQLEATE